jgi:Domain of unknown function (DUF4410)
MKAFIAALTAILYASSGLFAAGPPPTPYTAVEVDRFVAAAGVTFPADYQSALVEDIARDVSLAFPSVIIVRQGDALPSGKAVLRISGTVIEFKPGNRTKRQLIGMGAGATVVETLVWFLDAATGQVLLSRGAKGVTRSGIAGGDSLGAADGLAKKIAKFCNANHLVESN